MANKHRRLSVKGILLFISILLLTACSKEPKNRITEIDTNKEAQVSSEDEVSEDVDDESTEPDIYVPDKETVLLMRELALEGMTQEQIDSLTKQVTAANLGLEDSIFYDDLWKRLSDPKDLKWNYLDKVGEIQIGWAYESTDVSQEESGLTREEYEQTYGIPVVDNNDMNADSYIKIIDDLSAAINNKDLKADFSVIKDSLTNAKETHDVNEIVKIYEILHDMDYFLLRYGIEDVGKFVRDQSTISKYYGVLTIYQSKQETNTNPQ